MLIDEWEKFRGWLVLEPFLEGDERIYIKELSRKLKISPRTAQFYLDVYEKEGILEREKVGNALLYHLSDIPVVLALKRFFIILIMKDYIENFVKQNKGISSVVLYGSSSTGEFDKRSDIDLLIISQTKDLNLVKLKALEERLGKEVKVEILSIGEWRRLALKKDHFYLSVVGKHTVLYGVKL